MNGVLVIPLPSPEELAKPMEQRVLEMFEAKADAMERELFELRDTPDQT